MIVGLLIRSIWRGKNALALQLIDGLNINLNDNVKNFFDVDAVLEQNVIPTITVPTRITADTATAIHHIIVNEQLIKTQNHAGNIYCDISHHLPNFLIINNDEEPTRNRPYVRIYGEKNMIQFRNKIHNADWGELLSTNNVEHAMDMFHKTYYNTSFTSSPQKGSPEKGQKTGNG